jgi:hypothetical protein
MNAGRDRSLNEINAALGLLMLSRTGRKRHAEPGTRTSKTLFQKMVLEKVFAISPHPSAATKLDLSLMLNLPLKTIQIWFQNERNKRQKAGTMSTATTNTAYAIDVNPLRLFDMILYVLNKDL